MQTTLPSKEEQRCSHRPRLQGSMLSEMHLSEKKVFPPALNCFLQKISPSNEHGVSWAAATAVAIGPSAGDLRIGLSFFKTKVLQPLGC